MLTGRIGATYSGAYGCCSTLGAIGKQKRADWCQRCPGELSGMFQRGNSARATISAARKTMQWPECGAAGVYAASHHYCLSQTRSAQRPRRPATTTEHSCFETRRSHREVVAAASRRAWCHFRLELIGCLPVRQLLGGDVRLGHLLASRVPGHVHDCRRRCRWSRCCCCSCCWLC